MNTVQIYTWNFIGTQKEPRLYKPDMSKWSPYELDVEAPEDYILPDGYDLATAESGEPIIIDSKGNGCELIHYQGKPAIVTNNGIIILKSAAAAALGRKGGSVKSEAKARAARENGKKGGRPKMYKQEVSEFAEIQTMKYTIVCGNYTSAEYETTQEAMEYVDENVDEIRNEGGRYYPISIVDSNNDVVAERGYISQEELSTWECI